MVRRTDVEQSLAYIILNYDVEVLGEPKKKKAFVNVVVPDLDVEIRVRWKHLRRAPSESTPSDMRFLRCRLSVTVLRPIEVAEHQDWTG